MSSNSGQGGVGLSATEEAGVVEDAERLRRLSVNDAALLSSAESEQGSRALTKSQCLARVSALIALSGPSASVMSEVDAAVSAGARSADFIALLDAILPLVGRPRVVAAAPKIALALGYDAELGWDE